MDTYYYGLISALQAAQTNRGSQATPDTKQIIDPLLASFACTGELYTDLDLLCELTGKLLLGAYRYPYEIREIRSEILPYPTWYKKVLAMEFINGELQRTIDLSDIIAQIRKEEDMRIREQLLDERLEFDRADLIESYKSAIVTAETYTYLGNRAYGQGKYEEALQNYDQAMRVDPNYHSAYSHRGNAYLALNQYHQAISDYDRALELVPHNASTYIYRGLAYQKLGDLDKAISDYDHVITLDPHNVDAYLHRGYIYLREKGYQNCVHARTDLEYVIELDPLHPDKLVIQTALAQLCP